MARPEKINPQTVDVICKALEMGAKRDAAAHVAGIHVATLYAWISRGKEESEGLYYELSERIKKSESMAQLRALKAIQDAAQLDWKPAAWLLERRFGFTVNQQPILEINLDADVLTVKQLIQDIKKSDDIIKSINGPTIDLDEE